MKKATTLFVLFSTTLLVLVQAGTVSIDPTSGTAGLGGGITGSCSSKFRSGPSLGSEPPHVVSSARP